MPSLFTKSLETLTPDDVQQVIGWPESLTVEFKRELPGRDGRPDPWISGGKVDEYARIRLFKEIVALANTAGGHLLIGVDEDGGNKPPTALRIAPVPRCADLAERLIQMAQSIDPPIPYLVATGVATDGKAGVVVVRVPASKAAPHRSTDREVYVRRGTSSMPVSMREVRDMILAAEQMDGIYQQEFRRAGAEFRAWVEQPFNKSSIKSPLNQAGGFRITAAPASAPLKLPRLFNRFNQSRFRERFDLSIDNGTPSRFDALRMPCLFRPIVRGVHSDFAYNDNSTYLEVLESGFVTMGWRTGARPGHQECQIYLARIIPHLLNILHVADGLRSEAGVPEHEYQIEIELYMARGASMRLALWGVGFNDDLDILNGTQLPMIFPRLSYGPAIDTDMVLSTFATDFSDAGGARRVDGISIRLASRS